MFPFNSTLESIRSLCLLTVIRTVRVRQESDSIQLDPPVFSSEMNSIAFMLGEYPSMMRSPVESDGGPRQAALLRSEE